MKNLLFIPALLMMAACGMSEDKFAEKFEENYCATLDECDGDFTCDDIEFEVNDDADCDFDPKAAKDCINGEWTCDDNGFPELPKVCEDVADCPEEEEEEEEE